MQKKDIQKLTEENPAWDEHWGSPIVRHRHNTLVKNGISETGRAAQYLSLAWGLVETILLLCGYQKLTIELIGIILAKL